MLAAQEGEGRSSSAVRLAGRWRLLGGFSVLQNVKIGSLGAWYVMHDLNPGRYRVEEQYGPNASSFAQISSRFDSSRKAAWSYFEVPADGVRCDKHGP